MSKPKIITLCGSSKFVGIMAVLAWWLERDEGAIVHTLHLLPHWYGAAPDHLAEAEGVADKLDALHLQKIDLSDEVFIVNWQGYIGDSTRNEIKHAIKDDTPLRWLAPPPEEFQGFIGPVYDPAYRERMAACILAGEAQDAGEAMDRDRD